MKGLFAFVGNAKGDRLNSYRNVQYCDLKMNFPRWNFRNPQ
ncbi:hypothetical protein LEP1GSC163_2453 [Leptospira santarosai str. CBC379]|nr:hypothetical protein LEP1GSC163_2453 [Leptospira santarosai str. CBC379]